MGEDLCLIVMDNCKELGEKVNSEIQNIRNTTTNYILPIDLVRFKDGEGKAVLLDSVRGKDVYILSDTHNYSITYPMYNFEHHMSPDEHFQDIKRVISAIMKHAKSVKVIMPLWYGSRQHRSKDYRESLDVSMGLRDLERMGVSGMVTFDMHDINSAANAVDVPFDNFYATNDMLKLYLRNEELNLQDTYVISPDGGALERARFLANILGVKFGTFEKSRANHVVNGQNPIDSHTYLGDNVEGKTILVADDMLSSGGSMLDVAYELKDQGARKINFFTTFALFTNGPAKFEKAYEEGYFNGLYSTNLTYVPEAILQQPWFYTADCSKYLAKIIDHLNLGHSISALKQDNSAMKLARVKPKE